MYNHWGESYCKTQRVIYFLYNKCGIIVSELQHLSLIASVAFREQWMLLLGIIDPSLHFDNYLMQSLSKWLRLHVRAGRSTWGVQKTIATARAGVNERTLCQQLFLKVRLLQEAENKPSSSINSLPVREGWRLQVEPESNLWLDNQGQ